jgi:hypothetical protein
MSQVILYRSRWVQARDFLSPQSATAVFLTVRSKNAALDEAPHDFYICDGAWGGAVAAPTFYTE